ncbi:hypothetical protein ACTNEN_13010 [Oribacterium sp. HCP28S3_H8]
MKVFIDSNVLFSAALFPGSTPARALYKALTDLRIVSPGEFLK